MADPYLPISPYISLYLPGQVELAISMAESRRDVDVLKAKIGALKVRCREI